MEIDEFTVYLEENKSLVIRVFEENGEIKGIVADGYKVALKLKDSPRRF